MVLGLALLLPGCSARGDSPAPKKDLDTAGRAAAALAAGIARKDLSQVAFADTNGTAVQAQFAPLVAGMGSVKPVVTVASVDEQGSNATAVLHYVWSFPGVPQQWTYDGTAGLVEEGGSWLTSWSPTVVAPGLTSANRLSGRRELAPRGKILGADGEAIVALRPVVRIGIDKTRVSTGKAAAAAERLAKLVKINAKTYVAKVRAAGSADFVEAIVLRAADPARPSNKAVYAIAGAIPMSGQAMLAPNRTFARAIIGSVGEASKEILDASQGRVAPGDVVGRSGLQRRYDPQLGGTPGVTVQLTPADPTARATPSVTPTPDTSPPPSASAAATVFEVKPVAGQDLTLTLSIPLQDLAERVLAKTKPASAMVAIRPSTGEVLAAANGPGSDDLSVATVGRFPPGSTFKVASSLALLRAGLKPTSPVTCPPTITVNGKKFKNYSDYPSSHLGDITLRTALAQSCNTAFIGARGRLSGPDLAEAAASLGLGVDYDVGFSSFFGSVNTDPTATGRAAAMIGQGKVLASPLSMAAVAASVAAGKTVVPRLVTSTQVSPKAKPLTKAEVADLRDMMATVVTEGSGRVLKGVGGSTVMAKTGTAEYGPKPPFKKHAWMIAASGDLAVSAFVATGVTGSHTAGPLLARFLATAQRSGTR